MQRQINLKKMNAKLDCAFGVFVSNGEVFIADTGNHRVRKLLRNGQIVTIAGNGNKGSGIGDGDGQLATDSLLHYPMGVFVSSSNQVYISEDYSHKIRKIDRHGIISTIAGTGVEGYNGDNQLAIHAQLNFPRGLFVNEDEEIFFCDGGNHRVRKIDRFGMISTVAGNGEDVYNGDDILAINAALNFPTSVYVYKHEVYITDTYNQRIRKVLQNGIIKTIAKRDSNLCLSHGICVHNDTIYFSDYYNHSVRILPNGTTETISATTEPQTLNPTGLFVDDSGIYICCEDSKIRKVDLNDNGIITTIIGTGERGYSGDIPFDFTLYPHIGPRKKISIKPFSNAYHDMTLSYNSTINLHIFNDRLWYLSIFSVGRLALR